MNLVVRDQVAAHLLSQAKVQRILHPFMRQECHLKMVSEELNMPLNLLHYWVGRLLKAGLLRLVRYDRQAGRKQNYYRAVSERFVVLESSLPPTYAEESDVAWLKRFRLGLEQTMPELSGRDGLQISVDQTGSLNVDPAGTSERWNPGTIDLPAVLNTWTDGLNLSSIEARALQSELWEVFKRYMQLEKTGNRRAYILHLGLARVADG
jgi:hypothetical protein